MPRLKISVGGLLSSDTAALLVFHEGPPPGSQEEDSASAQDSEVYVRQQNGGMWLTEGIDPKLSLKTY